MPKSSIATEMPARWQRASAAIAGSRNSADSVISSCSDSGGRSCRSSSASVCCRNPGRSTSGAGTLTAACSRWPSPRQRLSWPAACSSAHTEILAARPAWLGERHEAFGCEQPVHRVLPAGQGLDGGDGVVAQVEQRLVVQDQLVALESLAQLGQRGPAPHLVLAHRVGVDGGHAEREPLRAVHRQVGGAQQRDRVVAVLGGEGHADAGGHPDDAALDDDPRVQRRVDLTGQPPDGVLVAAVAHHRELVAAEPRGHETGHGTDRPQSVAHRPQHRVTDLVAEGVVDLLEPVEVQQQQGRTPPGLQTGAQRLEQQVPVAEPGEYVGRHQLEQLLLDLATAVDLGLLLAQQPGRCRRPARSAR